MSKQGLFVVIEGPNGSGKTTLVENLTRALAVDNVTVSEPSKSVIGQSIREVLKDSGKIPPGMLQPMFLLDRMVEIQDTIKPALARGAVVISDRWAVSSIIYSRNNGGFADEGSNIHAVYKSVCDIIPNVTIVLNCDVDLLVQRRPSVSKQDAEEISRQYNAPWARELVGDHVVYLDAANKPEDLTRTVRDIILNLQASSFLVEY